MGEDGKTPQERIKGKKFKTQIVEFGEGVRYIMPESAGKDKWDVRWREGIFLVIRDSSGEFIVGTTEGAIKVRGIRRLARHSDRWDCARLNSMEGVPNPRQRRH